MMKRRTFLKIVVGGLVFSGAAAGGAGIFLHQPAFGAVPEETPVFPDSFHYRNGAFHNTLPTPILSDGSSFAGALVRSLFAKKDLFPHFRFHPYMLNLIHWKSPAIWSYGSVTPRFWFRWGEHVFSSTRCQPLCRPVSFQHTGLSGRNSLCRSGHALY